MKGREENTARKERRKQVKKSQFPEKSIKFRVGEKAEGGRRKAEGGKYWYNFLFETKNIAIVLMFIFIFKFKIVEYFMEKKNSSAEEIIWKCPKGCNAFTFNKSTRRCNECGSHIQLQCSHCNNWISLKNKATHLKNCLEGGSKKRKLEEVDNQKVIIN